MKQGKLKHWNEDRGFGFIVLKNEAQDIFIHISALKKMSRRPVVGDIIFFQIHIDNTGKKRAINARIKGVSLKSKNIKKKTDSDPHSNHSLSTVISFILIALTTYFLYSFFLKSETQTLQTNNVQTKAQIMATPVSKIAYKNNSQFSCQGKVYCSQMTSCGEAKYYLTHCEGTEIDGDGDGIPCERQWCQY